MSEGKEVLNQNDQNAVNQDLGQFKNEKVAEAAAMAAHLNAGKSPSQFVSCNSFGIADAGLGPPSTNGPATDIMTALGGAGGAVWGSSARPRTRQERRIEQLRSTHDALGPKSYFTMKAHAAEADRIESGRGMKSNNPMHTAPSGVSAGGDKIQHQQKPVATADSVLRNPYAHGLSGEQKKQYEAADQAERTPTTSRIVDGILKNKPAETAMASQMNITEVVDKMEQMTPEQRRILENRLGGVDLDGDGMAGQKDVSASSPLFKKPDMMKGMQAPKPAWADGPKPPSGSGAHKDN